MLPSLHLGEINIGIHVCQFTFEPTFYTFVSIQWRMEGFDEKKARIGGFAYPYSPPQKGTVRFVKKNLEDWDTFLSQLFQSTANNHHILVNIFNIFISRPC